MTRLLPDLPGSWSPNDLAAEYVARKFHEHYEQLAPRFRYCTREASAVPWSDVPADNKALMIATARALILHGDIVVPSARVSSSGSRATATEGEDDV